MRITLPKIVIFLLLLSGMQSMLEMQGAHADGAILDQQQTIHSLSNTGSWNGSWTSVGNPGMYLIQSFTPGLTGGLESIAFPLKSDPRYRTSEPLVVEIIPVNSDGTADLGTVLGTTEILASSVSDQFVEVSATFTSPPQLFAGQLYAVRLSIVNAQSGYFYQLASSEFADPHYVGGRECTKVEDEEIYQCGAPFGNDGWSVGFSTYMTSDSVGSPIPTITKLATPSGIVVNNRLDIRSMNFNFPGSPDRFYEILLHNLSNTNLADTRISAAKFRDFGSGKVLQYVRDLIPGTQYSFAVRAVPDPSVIPAVESASDYSESYLAQTLAAPTISSVTNPNPVLGEEVLLEGPNLQKLYGLTSNRSALLSCADCAPEIFTDGTEIRIDLQTYSESYGNLSGDQMVFYADTSIFSDSMSLFLGHNLNLSFNYSGYDGPDLVIDLNTVICVKSAVGSDACDAPTPPAPTPPAVVPDPPQRSAITDWIVSSAPEYRNQIAVDGNFPESISNISVDGSNLPMNSWIQTLNSVQIDVRLLGDGSHELQIFNGSAPLLKSISVISGSSGQKSPIPKPVQAIKIKATYFICKKGRAIRHMNAKSQTCPSGYVKQGS